jgi:hypothetical protein
VAGGYNVTGWSPDGKWLVTTKRDADQNADVVLFEVDTKREVNVTQSPWIVRHGYAPHPKQQQFLLHVDTPEVFYGGAGGGGKSQALWYAALQYVEVPGYAALILRRTYADQARLGRRSAAYTTTRIENIRSARSR